MRSRFFHLKQLLLCSLAGVWRVTVVGSSSLLPMILSAAAAATLITTDAIPTTNCTVLKDQLSNVIKGVDLSTARWIVYQSLSLDQRRSTTASSATRIAPARHLPCEKQELIKDYRYHTQKIFQEHPLEYIFEQIRRNTQQHHRQQPLSNNNSNNSDEWPNNSTTTIRHKKLRAKVDRRDCSCQGIMDRIDTLIDQWDECCALYPRDTDGPLVRDIFATPENHVGVEDDEDEIDFFIRSGCWNRNMCCEFFPPSRAYLRLPVLYEPAIRMRIPVVVRKETTAVSMHDHQHFSSFATTTTTTATPSTDTVVQAAIATTGTTRWDALYDTTIVLDLEQDAYLRLHETSGVLWPSGYLLAQCLSDPWTCHLPDQLLNNLLVESPATFGKNDDSVRTATPLAIELGAGIGAASIALAIQLQSLSTVTIAVKTTGSIGANGTNTLAPVLATDISPYALALCLANAQTNGIDLPVAVLNHTDVPSLIALRERYAPRGFVLVMGSSLQEVFVNTSHSDCILWQILDILLDRENPHPLAVFVHTQPDAIEEPHDGRYTRIWQLSGDVFGMPTRTGASSDFVVYMFRPSHPISNDEL